MIDTHAHLDLPEFADDLPDVLHRASREGVASIITVGTGVESSAKAVALAERHTNVCAAVGIHPNECAAASEADWAKIKELAAHTKVVAIGETGLDFYRDRCPRDAQEKSFRHAIALAQETGRPLIVHCREAVPECIQILKGLGQNRIRGVMHCFSGSAAQAGQLLSLGLYLSFAGQLTFPSAQNLRETAKTVPLERTLLETDCPFLAPEAHRGKRNEPAFLKHTVEQLAALHDVLPADVDRMTTVNAYRLFKVGQRPQRGNIAYTIRNSRYLNITNRCTNRCVFCSRMSDSYVKGYHLRIEAEPSLPQIIAAMGDMSKYEEVVFAGLGEPTMRMDIVTAIAKKAKARGIRTRLNTNGQGALVNRRNICAELAGLVDRISISLTTTDAGVYQRLCRPEDPGAFRAVMAFVEEARKTFPEVEITSVTIPEVNAEALKAWAATRNVALRFRTPRRMA